MPLTKLQVNALHFAAESAHVCEVATGLPAALTVAQWALESHWGDAQPQNNCFGIKGYPGAAGAQDLETWEEVDGKPVSTCQTFATFPTLAQCFIKHAQIITNGESYRKAWLDYKAADDIPALIRAIAPIYATDPEYADKIFAILAMPEVHTALNTVNV